MSGEQHGLSRTRIYKIWKEMRKRCKAKQLSIMSYTVAVEFLSVMNGKRHF